MPITDILNLYRKVPAIRSSTTVSLSKQTTSSITKPLLYKQPPTTHNHSSNAQQAQAAAEDINSFVSDTTRGKIPQLVSADSVSGAVMVLVNAVYFKGVWDRQFQVENTAPQKFFVTPNSPATVPMMNQEGKFKYGKVSLFLCLFLLSFLFLQQDLHMPRHTGKKNIVYTFSTF